MTSWCDAYVNALWAFTLFFAVCKALSDNRCYLESGASSESFFVPEDLPVGAVVGGLRVVGDPAATISLRLREPDAPVAIAAGTKNLTLRRPLDKEGVAGPASVFVSVVCERLHSPEPGLVIPVSIRVTDANDNAPVFVNAPYALNISEVTVVGTRVLQGVHAVDADQQGPFSSVRYAVLPGPHSDFFEFENELEGTLVLKRALDYETLKSFDVYIRAQDHGDPPKKTDTVLTVNVVDADDQNPRFLDDRYTAALPDPAKKGAALAVKPREVKAFDQDLGINAPIYYAFNGVGADYAFFKINRLTGKVALARDLEERDLAHPATLVVRATQQDNPDRYALATLTVERQSGAGVRFLHSVFYMKVREDTAPGVLVGVLSNNRPGEQLKYFVSDQSVLKTFAINMKGEVTLRLQLDYEEKSEYVFKVFATDGITNDSSVVNISVADVNEWEPRFRMAGYEFWVGRDAGAGAPVGRVEAADGDGDGGAPTLTVAGADASLFFVTPAGEVRMRGAVPADKKTAQLTVTATDGGDPPRRSTVPVTVHFVEGAAAAAAGREGAGAGAPILLAGLGAALLLLMFVVALLVAYICKVKRSSRGGRDVLPSVAPPTAKPRPKVNPVFAAAAAARGEAAGAARLPSPKVHPAPQPPARVAALWPPAASVARVKKLSWGDKTDSDSAENINNTENSPVKLSDSTNLTVYF